MFIIIMSLQHFHTILHSHFVLHNLPIYCTYGQIPSRLAEQPISVLDKEYEEVAEFLHGYSGIHACLEELSLSHALVKWLKEAMKGIL